jgi:hypothetical protein
MVQLWREGRGTNYEVHRLVAITFIRPPLPGEQVRHGTAGKLVNRPGNLCYGTAADNAADRDRDDKTVRGERVHRAKLTPDLVREIRSRYPAESQDKLAIEYGVYQTTIGYIVRHKTWKHVL